MIVPSWHWTQTPSHRTLLVARQALADAAVNFALIAETEPCVSIRYDAAMERLHTAAKDYTECSIRCGLMPGETLPCRYINCPHCKEAK